MESLLKQVPLTQDVTRVLDEIRAGAENALYGVESDKSEELFAKHVVSLVEGAGLPVLQVMHYRWFLRELSRLWRTRKGRDLAFHLELCIRKWVELGLEPRTLQFLVCEAHERLKAANLNTAKACPARSYGGGATRTAPQDEISRQARNDEAARGVERDVKGGDMTETGSAVSNRVPSPDGETATSEDSLPRSLDPSIPGSTTAAAQPAGEQEER